MKRLLLLLTLVLVGYIAVNRQRIYLRDPVAAVYRGGVKQGGDWVFINYSNDVLVEAGGVAPVAEFLVQGWNGVPGVPGELKCVLGMACLAAADHAPMVPLAGANLAAMTNREVGFVDGDGVAVRVTLR